MHSNCILDSVSSHGHCRKYSEIVITCHESRCALLHAFKFSLKNYTWGIPNRTAISQDWAHQSSLASWGQEYLFLLRNPRVMLALVQTLLTCVFHLKLLVIVTPRYLMLSTFARSVPSNVYEAWILIRFLVSCIILHLTG